MPKQCDNTSVGVIIENNDKIALLTRAKFPIAVAAPAGHIDSHGSPEQAALNEVFEEIGLTIALKDLVPTHIANRTVKNQCRRIGGTHHAWWVYRANQFTGDLKPSADETQGAKWYSKDELRQLIARTNELVKTDSTQEEWQENPGLEEIWATFLTELGYTA